MRNQVPIGGGFGLGAVDMAGFLSGGIAVDTAAAHPFTIAVDPARHVGLLPAPTADCIDVVVLIPFSGPIFKSGLE